MNASRRHVLCPACGAMSCEHLAAELERLREAAGAFAELLARPGLDASTRDALQELLEAAGTGRVPPSPRSAADEKVLAAERSELVEAAESAFSRMILALPRELGARGTYAVYVACRTIARTLEVHGGVGPEPRRFAGELMLELEQRQAVRRAVRQGFQN